MKTVLITGGHLTPALATIEEFQRRKSWHIRFVGRQYAMEGDVTPSIESKLVPQKGVPFFAIEAGRIQRKITRYTPGALLKIPKGFFQSLVLMNKIKPDVVLSFGGYVSVPVVLAAWLHRIPIVTHEQTTVRGLANWVNSWFANKIAVSWPRTRSHFLTGKTVLTGNPIRKDCFKVDEKLWADVKFGHRPFVLITGGNQGSHTINRLVQSVLKKLLLRVDVLHQCGHVEFFGDFKGLDQARKRLPVGLQKSYHLRRYLTAEEMGTFLNKATLVVTRGGANTMTELVALAKPALVIPISFLAEQRQNGQMLVNLGMAEMVVEEKLTQQKFLATLEKMLDNIDYFQKNAYKNRLLVKKDAAKKIVTLVEKLAA